MPFSGLLSLGITAGGQIGKAILGSNEASNEQNAQLQGIQNAIGAGTTTTNQANQTLQNFYNQNLQQLQPYLNLGQQGAAGLSGALGSGQLTQGYAPFTAPNPNDVANTPEYQFAQQQGTRGVMNSDAAAGLDKSGGELKDLSQFNQGLASQQYEQAYQNALNTYNTNFNTFNTTGTNLYNRLMGITGTGQQGATTAAGLGQQVGSQQSGNYINLGDLLSSAYTQQGNVNAAAATQQGNAQAGLLGGGLNDLATWYGRMYPTQSPAPKDQNNGGG